METIDNISMFSAPALPGCLRVPMGKLEIGAHSGQLQALLGSCVGIAFLWKKRGCCGLAHCLLPEAPDRQCDTEARYVSQAVPSLLRLMGATEADYPDIEVVVAGGAHMFGRRAPRLQVGQQNAAAAHKYLRECGLNVSYCRLGGKCGRTLTIDCATQSYAVTDIVATPQDSIYARH
ncbi:MAG: chemotaxis protein CheD [Pseudomonadota bacterium]